MLAFIKCALALLCFCAFAFFAYDHAKDGEYWSMLAMLFFMVYSAFLFIGAFYEWLMADLIALRDMLRRYAAAARAIHKATYQGKDIYHAKLTA